MKKSIAISTEDGAIVYVCWVVNDIDLKDAIRNACTEFCQTEEGKLIYSGNANCFNWGDFDIHVPDELCAKHGFQILQRFDADLVDLHEQLVEESDIFPEE